MGYENIVLVNFLLNSNNSGVIEEQGYIVCNKVLVTTGNNEIKIKE